MQTKSNTKYGRLARDLAEQIRSGQLSAGAQLPPERELMKLHGVSYSTVTRAMSELRHAGLVDREWGRGTFVRVQPTPATNLALVFDSVHCPSDPYLTPIVEGVGQAARRYKCHWQVFPMSHDCLFSGQEGSLLCELIQANQLHGIMTCSPFPSSDVQRLVDSGVATITILNEYPSAQAPWVVEDVAQGAAELVRHVVDSLGHRRIALVMGPESSAGRIGSSQLLADELRRQLLQRGIVVPTKRVLHGDLLHPEPVAAAARQWLAADDPPTAILTAVDRDAMEVLDVASTLGVQVPDELSVATWHSEIVGSPLTSVKVDLPALGREAVRLAVSSISGESVSPSVMPVQFIERKTTARVPSVIH